MTLLDENGGNVSIARTLCSWYQKMREGFLLVLSSMGSKHRHVVRGGCRGWLPVVVGRNLAGAFPPDQCGGCSRELPGDEMSFLLRSAVFLVRQLLLMSILHYLAGRHVRGGGAVIIVRAKRHILITYFLE